MPDDRIHPLVQQLKFTRSEWVRAFANLEEEESRRKIEPINSLSWMIGHLAWHEQLYWLKIVQGKILLPELDSLVGYGSQASTPPLVEMWAAWFIVTTAADQYLNYINTKELTKIVHFQWKGGEVSDTIGTMLQRLIYHYWYHIGESQALRQLLGHKNLAEYVGDIKTLAPFCPENNSIN